MHWTDTRRLKDDLRRLDDSRFVELCNDLLRAFGDRHGIDRTHFNTTFRVNDPDGGIDAWCRDAPTAAERLVPGPRVAYQFKSGEDRKSAKKLATADILKKRGVVGALRDGCPFIYLAARDYRAGFEEEVLAVVRKKIPEVRPGQIRIVGGVDLAAVLQAYPGVLAKHVGGVAPFLSWDQWARNPAMGNPFCTDIEVEHQIEDLRRAVEGAQSRTRVVGRAGDGKTRSVLEAFRRSPLRDTVLYAQSTDEVSFEVWDALSHAEAAECTIVVDEVDTNDHERLVGRFGSMPPGVRLVTIGIAPTASNETGFVKVAALNPGVLIQAMGAVAQGAPQQAIEDAARACGGSPKLAVLVARRIREDPSLAQGARILGDYQTRDLLERYLGIDVTDPRWHPLAAAALLDRVGWSGDLEHESTCLFKAVELDAARSRLYVHDIHERYGVAPRTRRLLYVSPDLLADHLAARLIESWPPNQVRAFYEHLTPGLRDRFGKRLRRIADALPNRESVEEVILGPEGPFQSLRDVEGSPIASLLARLAGPFRHATLGALARIVGPASFEELEAAKDSRRVLVDALTELLWFANTFEDAATLLLRLAVAENESYGNNASGIWVETFQAPLGRTEAGGEARARVLQEAASGADKRARILAAKGLASGFRTGNVSRIGMPPREVADAPQEAWRPTTYREWKRTVLDYLHVVGSLLEDSEPQVQEAAVEALGEAADLAWILEDIGEAWSEVARKVESADYTQRAALVDSIDWALRRAEQDVQRKVDEGDFELQEVIQGRISRLNEVRVSLLGTDFTSRFRRVVGADAWKFSAEDQGDGPPWPELAAELADEIVSDPALLEQEWEWLTTCSGNGPERFMDQLGRIDTGLTRESELRDKAREVPRAIRWLSLYLVARSSAEGTDQLVDSRIAEFTSANVPRAWAFDLLTLVSPSEPRRQSMIALFERGELEPQEALRLMYTPMLQALSVPELVRLERALPAPENGGPDFLQLLAYYLHHHPHAVADLQELAVRLLRVSATAGRTQAQREWEWSEVAKRYVDVAPLDVGQAALVLVEASESTHVYGIQEVISRAKDAAGPDDFFHHVVAAWLDHEDLVGWWVRQTLPATTIRDLDPGPLLEWIRQRPKPRAMAVAEVLGAPYGDAVSGLHGQLLDEFDKCCRVGSVFYGALVSGMWSGSAAARTKGLLEMVKRWTDDDRRAVRRWAENASASLESMLERDEIEEEEEEFRW